MRNRMNKSHYRVITIAKIVKCILMIILISIIIYCKVYENTIRYTYGFIMINSLCIMYFGFSLEYIKKNIKKNHAILTDYSKIILLRYKVVMCIYIVCILLFSIFSVYIRAKIKINLPIWYWFVLQLPMMYCDAVYLSGITAIGEKAYCSGDYVVEYSKIEEYKEVMHKSTFSGEMVLVEIFSKDGLLGYDKFFLEEYHNLRLKTYQNNDFEKKTKRGAKKR